MNKAIRVSAIRASLLSSSPSTKFTQYRCCFCEKTLINQPLTGAEAPTSHQLDRQAQLSSESDWVVGMGIALSMNFKGMGIE